MPDNTRTHGVHLPSLSIRGFRGVPSLDIKRLGQVTLLAGRNGVGKTTVLDAVRLYAERGRLPALREVLIRHEEVEARPDDDDGWDERPAFDALFSGRRLDVNSQFVIGPLDDGSQLCATIVPPSAMVEEQLELFMRRGGQFDSHVLEVAFGAHREYWPVLDVNDSAYDPRSLYGRWMRHPTREAEWPDSAAYVALGPGLPSNRQVAAYWDELAARPGEKLVLGALQLACASDIDRVAAVAGPKEYRDRRIVVGLANGERVPLRSLGDGATRLFGLATAFSSAADGFLLIDEAENGIHHSLQADYWRLVFRAARDHNVQVLATTHSWDCVEGFAMAAGEDEQAEGLAVRLERHGNALRAVDYGEETLSVAAERGIEIR